MDTINSGYKDVFLIQDLYFRGVLAWYLVDHPKRTGFQVAQKIEKAIDDFPTTQPYIISGTSLVNRRRDRCFTHVLNLIAVKDKKTTIKRLNRCLTH